MKRTFVLVDNSTSRPVRFRAGGFIIGLACLALAASIAGWGRLTVCAVNGIHRYVTLGKYRAVSTAAGARFAYLSRQLASNRSHLKVLSDYEQRLRLRYGLKPVAEEVRLAGVGGIPSRMELAVNSCRPIIKEAHLLEAESQALLRQAVLEDSLLTESGISILRQYREWAQTPSIKPTEGRLASRFGRRTDPMGGTDTRFHGGIDLANVTGTPVYASADGVVRYRGTQEGFGNVIRIRHERSGFETIYGHLDAFKVEEGAKVKRGDLIGLMGSTGRSTGPHLHYEVRKNGQPINPEKFLLPEDTVVD